MNPPVPTGLELATAIEEGARVVFGLPTFVRTGLGYATLNLVAAQQGDPDPWFVTAIPALDVVDLSTAGDRSIYVGGMLVDSTDLAAVTRALRLAPPRHKRHAAGANRSRREAGEAALQVTNTMIRARLLDAVDGWIAATGPLVDEGTDGALYDPPEESDFECRILCVVCPSTGRRYALRVPAEMRTAKEARGWTLRLEEQLEIET